jgi:cell wall-associated NlpC family hydrolase
MTATPMPMTEAEGRMAVLAEAQSWLRTPFHKGSSVKGVGIDCGNLLMASYNAAGIAMDLTPSANVSHDFFLNQRDSQILIGPVAARAHEVVVPRPGDCVLFYVGMAYGHAAIVARQGYPVVIQARWKACVQLADCTQGDMKNLKRVFYSPWSASPVTAPTAI